MKPRRGSRYHLVLNRRRWALVRREVFRRDGYRCRKCGRPGALECDHVVPLRADPDQDAYAVDGLQTLCRGCHIEKTASENRRPDPARDAWRELIRLI